MSRPTVVFIRHKNDVFRVDGADLQMLDPSDPGNANIIRRTYQSPFLDGLAFAGGYGSEGEAADGTHGADHTTGADHLDPGP